jgi:hypothetical protein
MSLTSQLIAELLERGLHVEFSPDLKNNLFNVSIMKPDGDLLNCIHNTSITFECANDAAADVIDMALTRAKQAK